MGKCLGEKKKRLWGLSQNISQIEVPCKKADVGKKEPPISLRNRGKRPSNKGNHNTSGENRL